MDKQECIIFSNNKDEAHMTLLAGTQVVKSQETLKILGVTLDTKMSLDQCNRDRIPAQAKF